MKIAFQSDELIVFESALFRTTTSLIIGVNYILLVDPNWLPVEIDCIQRTIDSTGKDKEKFLLFTHSDYDHIIGYGKFKEYTTIASNNFVENPSRDTVLSEIEKFDDEYYVKRTYPIAYPSIDIIISGENEKLKLGSDEYYFFQARGHNRDGLITYNKTKRILIAGDYLSNIEFPYIYDSIHNYLETLSKFEFIINENTVSMLIPGHGDCTADVSEINTRIKESRDYIHALVEAVTQKAEFNEKRLFERYDFPIIMQQFHQKNIELAAAEFKV
jgi:hydroxyacylglutathione hydrolase